MKFRIAAGAGATALGNGFAASAEMAGVTAEAATDIGLVANGISSFLGGIISGGASTLMEENN